MSDIQEELPIDVPVETPAEAVESAGASAVESVPESVSMGEIEEAARQQGWSADKGELGPLEFLSKGREFRDKMFDEIRELRVDNQKAYDIVAEHITQQNKREHEVQQQSLEDQVREATENGDVDKVLELTKQIAATPAPAAPAKDDPNMKVIDQWRTDNSWFTENSDMRDDALAFYQAEVNKLQGQDNPAEILPQVLERVKKVYPEKFDVANPNARRAAGVEKSGKISLGKKSGLSREDLTTDEGAHLDDYVKLGMKEEDLLKSIARQRASHG